MKAVEHVIGWWQVDELRQHGCSVLILDATTALVDGRRMRMLDAAEAEEVELVVCALWPGPGAFVDNVQDRCLDCGEAVAVRPLAPKRPKRICQPCAARRLAQEG